MDEGLKGGVFSVDGYFQAPVMIKIPRRYEIYKMALSSFKSTLRCRKYDNEPSSPRPKTKKRGDI